MAVAGGKTVHSSPRDFEEPCVSVEIRGQFGTHELNNSFVYFCLESSVSRAIPRYIMVKNISFFNLILPLFTKTWYCIVIYYAINKIKEITLKLCEVRPLTLKELADLLKRSSDGIRNNYLSPLIEEGKIRLMYPGQLNHPQQAYIAVKDNE